MSLANGQSEIDTVVLRLPDYGKEIRNWSKYSYNETFNVPCPAWSFTVSDEDTTLTSQLLVPGARVELLVNNLVQCSGFIDRKSTSADPDGGTVVTVLGRDILGPVVSATMDPRFKFAAGISVPSLVLTVLAPFGITTLYNADIFNIYVMSGYGVGSGKGQPVSVPATQQFNEQQADGSIKTVYRNVPGGSRSYASSVRPDLRALTADQIKPHSGEGVFAYLERLLRRLGLMLWAAADGSGVIIDKADFGGTASQRLIRKRSDPSANNIKRGEVVIDHTSQPSCIVATGRGGGITTANSHMRVIMINELTGLDDQGNPLPEVANIIVRYKGAKLLAVRPELVPFQRPLGDAKIAKPFFLKDDEATNLAQLEAFTRREMANRQVKALTASYDVVGHTYQGHPWTLNTLVYVVDEVCELDQNLWLLDRTFTKASSGGTTASLKLVLPFTFQIAQA